MGTGGGPSSAHTQPLGGPGCPAQPAGPCHLPSAGPPCPIVRAPHVPPWASASLLTGALCLVCPDAPCLCRWSAFKTELRNPSGILSLCAACLDLTSPPSLELVRFQGQRLCSVSLWTASSWRSLCGAHHGRLSGTALQDPSVRLDDRLASSMMSGHDRGPRRGRALCQGRSLPLKPMPHPHLAGLEATPGAWP